METPCRSLLRPVLAPFPPAKTTTGALATRTYLSICFVGFSDHFPAGYLATSGHARPVRDCRSEAHTSLFVSKTCPAHRCPKPSESSHEMPCRSRRAPHSVTFLAIVRPAWRPPVTSSHRRDPPCRRFRDPISLNVGNSLKRDLSKKKKNGRLVR